MLSLSIFGATSFAVHFVGGALMTMIVNYRGELLGVISVWLMARTGLLFMLCGGGANVLVTSSIPSSGILVSGNEWPGSYGSSVYFMLCSIPGWTRGLILVSLVASSLSGLGGFSLGYSVVGLVTC